MTRQAVFDWVRERYGTEPDYPWIKSPGNAVLRNRKNKWYGIIMDIPGSRIGLETDEYVDILNVKADPLLIDLLVKTPGFFRAYHMNKEQWVTILLDETVPEDFIKDLLDESYKKTSK